MILLLSGLVDPLIVSKLFLLTRVLPTSLLIICVKNAVPGPGVINPPRLSGRLTSLLVGEGNFVRMLSLTRGILNGVARLGPNYLNSTPLPTAEVNAHRPHTSNKLEHNEKSCFETVGWSPARAPVTLARGRPHVPSLV